MFGRRIVVGLASVGVLGVAAVVAATLTAEAHEPWAPAPRDGSRERPDLAEPGPRD